MCVIVDWKTGYILESQDWNSHFFVPKHFQRQQCTNSNVNICIYQHQSRKEDEWKWNQQQIQKANINHNHNPQRTTTQQLQPKPYTKTKYGMKKKIVTSIGSITTATASKTSNYTHSPIPQTRYVLYFISHYIFILLFCVFWYKFYYWCLCHNTT